MFTRYEKHHELWGGLKLFPIIFRSQGVNMAANFCGVFPKFEIARTRIGEVNGVSV